MPNALEVARTILAGLDNTLTNATAIADVRARSLELQINGGGRPVRICEGKNPSVRFPLAERWQDIGTNGRDFERRETLWVGFDVDGQQGHADGLTRDALNETCIAAAKLGYVEIRKSTSGGGNHLFVRFDPPIPTKNRAEHSCLAKVVRAKMTADAGFDFASRFDCSGSILWVASKRASTEKQSFALLKPATATLSEADLPEDWRNPPEAPTPAKDESTGGDIDAAIAAMRKITTKDNRDGSKRLFAYACRAVEHNLSDEDAIRAIRTMELERPFP